CVADDLFLQQWRLFPLAVLCVLAPPCFLASAQIHAERVKAFASRTTCAPCHSNSARIRGFPRLPSPATRVLDCIAASFTGMHPLSRSCTSGGAFPRYAGDVSTLFQNRTGSRNLLNAI